MTTTKTNSDSDLRYKNITKNKLDDEIAQHGIMETLFTILKFKIKHKLVELIRNNKDKIKDNYMKIMFGILYFNNVTFLRMIKGCEDFKFCENDTNTNNNKLMRFCAFIGSVECLD